MGAVKAWTAAGTPFAFEKLTVTSAVKALTASVYAPAGAKPAQRALVTVEVQAVHWRVDGGNPDGTTGHMANTTLTTGQFDSRIELNSAQEIANFKAFRAAAADATIQVTYYR